MRSPGANILISSCRSSSRRSSNGALRFSATAFSAFISEIQLPLVTRCVGAMPSSDLLGGGSEPTIQTTFQQHATGNRATARWNGMLRHVVNQFR